MKLVKTPSFVKFIFPGITWNFSSGEKCLYLTFDDGPHPEVTTFVLDELKKFNAKATFFCIGDRVQKYPDVYARIRKEGHRIGNHTQNHANGHKTDNENYFSEIASCAEHVDSNLFRPPYGKLRFSQYHSIKKQYRIVLWDVLSYDYDRGTTREQCLANVLVHSKKGSVVVFHDSEKAKEKLYFALPKVLQHFSEKGFVFRAIP